MNNNYVNRNVMFMLINFIRCLAYSECVSKDSGARDVFIFRNSINQFINIFLNE